MGFQTQAMQVLQAEIDAAENELSKDALLSFVDPTPSEAAALSKRKKVIRSQQRVAPKLSKNLIAAGKRYELFFCFVFELRCSCAISRSYHHDYVLF